LHFATASVGSVSLTFAVFVAGADFAAGADDLAADVGAVVAGALFVAGADLVAADPAVAAGAVALFAAVVAGAAPFFEAAAVAFVSTPPCPEQAPFPDVAEVVPSLQMLLLACALRRPLVMPRAITARAAERKRVRMGAPRKGIRDEGPGLSRNGHTNSAIGHVRPATGFTGRPF
jgi:hypothetical protein